MVKFEIKECVNCENIMHKFSSEDKEYWICLGCSAIEEIA